MGEMVSLGLLIVRLQSSLGCPCVHGHQIMMWLVVHHGCVHHPMRCVAVGCRAYCEAALLHVYCRRGSVLTAFYCVRQGRGRDGTGDFVICDWAGWNTAAVGNVLAVFRLGFQ